MERAQADELLAKLDNDWTIAGNGHLLLEKTYKFKDFTLGLDFVIRVAALAEEMQHHPDIKLSWGRVTLQIWTHSKKGLTENDFTLAEKCDRL